MLLEIALGVEDGFRLLFFTNLEIVFFVCFLFVMFI